MHQELDSESSSTFSGWEYDDDILNAFREYIDGSKTAKDVITLINAIKNDDGEEAVKKECILSTFYELLEEKKFNISAGSPLAKLWEELEKFAKNNVEMIIGGEPSIIESGELPLIMKFLKLAVETKYTAPLQFILKNLNPNLLTANLGDAFEWIIYVIGNDDAIDINNIVLISKMLIDAGTKVEVNNCYTYLLSSVIKTANQVQNNEIKKDTLKTIAKLLIKAGNIDLNQFVEDKKLSKIMAETFGCTEQEILAETLDYTEQEVLAENIENKNYLLKALLITGISFIPAMALTIILKRVNTIENEILRRTTDIIAPGLGSAIFAFIASLACDKAQEKEINAKGALINGSVILLSTVFTKAIEMALIKVLAKEEFNIYINIAAGVLTFVFDFLSLALVENSVAITS